MRDFGRCSYLLLIDDLQASLLKNFLIQGRIWSYKIQCDVLTQHHDDSSHQTHGTILSAHKEVHRGPEGSAYHPSLWANSVIHCFACLPKCCSEILTQRIMKTEIGLMMHTSMTTLLKHISITVLIWGFFVDFILADIWKLEAPQKYNLSLVFCPVYKFIVSSQQFTFH